MAAAPTPVGPKLGAGVVERACGAIVRMEGSMRDGCLIEQDGLELFSARVWRESALHGHVPSCRRTRLHRFGRLAWQKGGTTKPLFRHLQLQLYASVTVLSLDIPLWQRDVL